MAWVKFNRPFRRVARFSTAWRPDGPTQGHYSVPHAAAEAAVAEGAAVKVKTPPKAAQASPEALLAFFAADAAPPPPETPPDA